MRHLFSLIAFAVICSQFTISCKTHNETKPATTEELSQMNRDFAKALNDKDATTAANCYMRDAILLPPNEAPVSGRDNIKNYWQGAISAGVFDVKVATISTNSNGNMGYEIGRYELSMKDSTGKITTERGKYVELLKRDADGKWKSTHGIWNADTLALK